jgi:hypothetical protein
MEWNPLKLDLTKGNYSFCDYYPTQCISNGYYLKQPFISILHPQCPYEFNDDIKTRQEIIDSKNEEESYLKTTIILFIVLLIIGFILYLYS